MTFADRVLKYYSDLKVDAKLPNGVEVMNPYHDPYVMDLCSSFYKKYYSDDNGRRLILGINPGRHGAGITGIPFTDPVVLNDECGIDNDLVKRRELSSEFVYMLIRAMGGPDHFYKHYFFGSVSSLGFLKNGRNFNYYDAPDFYRCIKPTIVSNLIDQIGLGITSRTCYCLGQGKNYEYLKLLNIELKLFDRIVPFSHPRWVMQYKRKEIDSVIDNMIKELIR